MTPYSPGKPISEVQRELGLTNVVKLASNENPLGPSPLAVAAVRAAAETMNLYPDVAGYELRQAIAEKYGVPFEQVVLGNGSDELIRMLGWVLIDVPADEVLCGDPSFICYDEVANIAPCRLAKVPLDAGFVHDLSAMAKAVNERTRIVFIANPHNPTGTIARRPELERFLDDVPETALVVLDEAYFEFAKDEPDFPNGLEFVKSRLNVAVLRTLSKAHGLAGIRVGFGFVPPEVADAIQRARQPFNVNALAQAAGIAALGDEDHVKRTVENNRAGAAVIAKALRNAGARPAETFANFVFADLGRPSEGLVRALLEQGVIVRSGAPFGCPNCLRVTVGTPAENARFVEALAKAGAPSGKG